MDYLTENAKFICNQGGQITCKDSGNRKVTYDGKALLTTAASVKTKTGICVTLTAAAQGVAQPCKCQLTAWLPGFSPLKISSGNPILTDTAKNFCPVGGGNISVMLSGVRGHITAGSVPASVSIAAAKILDAKISDEQNKNSSDQENSDKQSKKSSEQKNFEGDKKDSQTQGTAKNPGGKKEQSPQLLSYRSKNLFCPYNENDENCKQCEYPRTPTTINNNSKELRDNYHAHIANENNRDATDRHYLKNQSGFNFQAHHLISGNQIFAPVKKTKSGKKVNRRAKLVRLANFCDYDINNALNCIMLVASGDDYGQNAGGKSASAYDTMSLSKIQWHVGGHSYTFSKEETQRIKTQIRFYKKKNAADIYSQNNLTSDDERILNYVDVVSAELDKIETALETCQQCQNTPERKKAFIGRLNNLSQKIKNMLGAFREKPQRSFPYYVSKEAFTYAFNLPRTAKIVLVRREEENFLFEKFRAERFDESLTSESGKKMVFKSINQKYRRNPKIFRLNTRQNKIDCIEFCDNIEFFVLADGVNFSDISFLPFDEEYTKNIGGNVEGGQNFLEKNETEILIWLRDMQGKYQYFSPKQRISDRKFFLENDGWLEEHFLEGMT